MGVFQPVGITKVSAHGGAQVELLPVGIGIIVFLNFLLIHVFYLHNLRIQEVEA